MRAHRILLAFAVVCAATVAQASEITDFPLETTRSTVSRESVRMQALSANHANAPRHDLSGPLVEPRSSRSRDEVRKEAAARMPRAQVLAMDHIGGM